MHLENSSKGVFETQVTDLSGIVVNIVEERETYIN